jgi:hypothetical protein
VFGAWHDWDTVRRQLAVLASEVSAQRLGEAVAFAEEAHGDQKRPAGEPYVEHLLEVVEILVSGAGVRDEDLLVAAVLHDVVEDTDRTAGEVGERFGPRVEEWVECRSQCSTRRAVCCGGRRTCCWPGGGRAHARPRRRRRPPRWLPGPGGQCPAVFSRVQGDHSGGEIEDHGLGNEKGDEPV